MRVTKWADPPSICHRKFEVQIFHNLHKLRWGERSKLPSNCRGSTSNLRIFSQQKTAWAILLPPRKRTAGIWNLKITTQIGSRRFWIPILHVSHKSPKTKLCPVAGSGILYTNHPKEQPLFPWWTGRKTDADSKLPRAIGGAIETPNELSIFLGGVRFEDFQGGPKKTSFKGGENDVCL